MPERDPGFDRFDHLLALFACAELFSRAGFPKGIVNCIHGDEDAVKALAAHPDIVAMAFVGDEPLAVRLARELDWAASCLES